MSREKEIDTEKGREGRREGGMEGERGRGRGKEEEKGRAKRGRRVLHLGFFCFYWGSRWGVGFHGFTLFKVWEENDK